MSAKAGTTHWQYSKGENRRRNWPLIRQIIITAGGTTKPQLSANGWFRTYNFGSQEAAMKRWKAAANTGADYIASDQYEELAEMLRLQKQNSIK